MEGASTIALRTPTIELAQLLKFAGLCGTGGDAKQAIAHGLVKLNGQVERQKGRTVRPGDRIEFEGKTVVVTAGPA